MILIQNAKAEKKLLVVLQYWAGDHAAVEDLGNLIADLERVPNQEADILFFGRHDTQTVPINSAVVRNLATKFQRVQSLRCRRMNATGYPYGANEMFYDLVHIVAEPQWRERYWGFINLEADCCPTHPGWINSLITRYKASAPALAIGHINERPVKHLNGVAVYSTDLLPKVFGPVASGHAMSPYDLVQAPKILPVSVDCPEIFLDFNRPTITAEDLFSSRKQGQVPSLFHGVKDGSARAIVRARHITLSPTPDLADQTVFTFFDRTELDGAEQQAQIALWKAAWKSRGWNPVVLGPLDVMKHPKYEAFRAAVSAFPTVNPKTYELVCYLRWLALGYVGGGLMVDYDVIPGTLFPKDIAELRKSDKLQPFQCRPGSAVPSAMLAPKGALAKWIVAMQSYSGPVGQEAGRAHLSDQAILNQQLDQDWVDATHGLVKEFGEDGWAGAQLVHFAAGACAKTRPGASKSMLMRQFLQL